MTLNVINGPFIEPGESLSDARRLLGRRCRAHHDAGRVDGRQLDVCNLDRRQRCSTTCSTLEGNEITMVVEPGAAVRIDREWASFWNFIKFRSGTRDHPVVQRERREFAITLSTAASRTAGRAQRGHSHGEMHR